MNNIEATVLKADKLPVAVYIFFAAFLVLGLSIYNDYGLTWDEPGQRKDNGYVNYNYITNGDAETLLNGNEKYHGPVFELLLVWGEKAFSLSDTRDIYIFRHLVVFLSFFIGCVFFFLLARKIFHNNQLALLGTVLLICSPRIFAESFYNSKDLPFLSFMIIAVYSQLIFLKRPGFGKAIFHGIATAVMIDIRIMGIIVPALTVFLYFFLPLLSGQQSVFRRLNFWANLGLFLAVFAGFTILFWPVLWEGPVHHFLQAYQEMSAYHWNDEVMYMGHKILSTELPWHYLPVWFIITTPPVYLLLMLAGMAALLWKFLRRPLRFLKENIDIAIMAYYFIAPAMMVILLHAVIYDGWRHLYFIYPFGLLMAIYALSLLWRVAGRFIFLRRLAPVVLSAQLIVVLYFIIHYHPHQQVYFSELMPRADMVKTWELDYWGQSYKNAVEQLLERDKRPVISCSFDNYPGRIVEDILTPAQRKRIEIPQDYLSADYLIVNYRFRWDYYPYPEYFSVKVRGMKVITVYKMN